jgi:diguanylate cyclase (GGDEF)-like protein/PAS domain S-box-containing protein
MSGPKVMDPMDAGRSDARFEDEAMAPVLAIVHGLPDATVGSGPDGRIVFANELAGELFGYSPEEMVGRQVQMLWPERVRERYLRNMRLYFATEHPLRFTTEAWGLRADGSEFVGEMSWGIVETAAGPLLLAIGRDVSARRAAEKRLRAVSALGERALAGAALEELAGDAVEQLRLTLPLERAELRVAGGEVLAFGGDARGSSLRLELGPDDELVVWFARAIDDDGTAFVRAVASILGTALVRLRSEERMRHEALHDPLTGLANRTLLRDRLEHALARSAREGAPTGVLFIDLDEFKRVNDAFGHAAGDAVLAELGQRLVHAVRPADTVARLGGDEFVVVCEEIDEETALALGRRLDAAIRRPLDIAGAEHQLTASIGIALGRDDPDSMMAAADAAVYQAKAAGRGRVELRR